MKKLMTMVVLTLVLLLAASTVMAAPPNPADLNGTWTITAQAMLRIYDIDNGGSRIKNVSISQQCELTWYWDSPGANVYNLYCTDGRAESYGWFQYVYDYGGGYNRSSGELYMVRFNNDPEDTYTVVDCLTGKANAKRMRGMAKISENDRPYFGYTFGECGMRR